MMPTTLVVAGNIRQFDHFMRETVLSNSNGKVERRGSEIVVDDHRYCYVTNSIYMKGYQNVAVVFVGTWYERADAAECKQEARTIELTGHRENR